jgi:MFS family permease
MIPKKHFTRASSMLSLAENGSGVLAPILAGALIGLIGIRGILMIDVVTFLFAIGALLVIYIPPVPRSAEGDAGKGSLLREAWYGFEFILKRPPLLGLQLVFFFGNFLGMFMWTLMAPTILAHTGDNTVALGTVQSIASIGGILGGLLIATWGGFKRRILGVLLGWSLSGVFIFAFGLGKALIPWAIAIFLLELSVMMVNPSNQAIWQSKVPPDVQGRVFSVRRMIAQVSGPLSMLLAGLLADNIFEPGMQTTGSLLNTTFGRIFGSGPGAGMSLLISITGLLTILVGLIPFGIPLIRNVETLLPDFKSDVEPAVNEETSVQLDNA